MKKILILLLCAFTAISVFAQKNAAAKKVLDATASKLSSLKGVKADFTATSFIGTTEQASSTGSIRLNGKKYRIDTPEVITWFDGKTQWSYLPENEEVNVTEPTKEEMQTMNPYAFIGLYKKGYNYSLTNTTYKGAKVYEIRLTAQKSTADIQEARVIISQDNLPLSVRIRQGKNTWTRIRISNLSGKQKFDDSTFNFPKADYPDAEIIDLR